MCVSNCSRESRKQKKQHSFLRSKVGFSTRRRLLCCAFRSIYLYSFFMSVILSIMYRIYRTRLRIQIFLIQSSRDVPPQTDYTLYPDYTKEKNKNTTHKSPTIHIHFITMIYIRCIIHCIPTRAFLTLVVKSLCFSLLFPQKRRTYNTLHSTTKNYT